MRPALTVGTVGALSGLTTGNGSTNGGSVTLGAVGTITVNQPINTQAGSGGTTTTNAGVTANAALTAGAGNIGLHAFSPTAVDEALMTDEDVPETHLLAGLQRHLAEGLWDHGRERRQRRPRHGRAQRRRQRDLHGRRCTGTAPTTSSIPSATVKEGTPPVSPP